MASPQLENGHTRIANELFEAIYQHPFKATELRLLCWVVRKTYGWRKKGGLKATMSEISEQTDIPRASVGWALNALLEAGVILRSEAGELSLNKDYETWAKASVQPIGRSSNPLDARRASNPLDVQPIGRQASNPLDASPYSKESNRKKCAEPQNGGSTPSPKSGLSFDTNGKEKTWVLPPDLAPELAAAFPGVDVDAEIRKAHAWCRANPTRRKTAKGMSRFLYSWVERANNGGFRRGFPVTPPAAAVPVGDADGSCRIPDSAF